MNSGGIGALIGGPGAGKCPQTSRSASQTSPTVAPDRSASRIGYSTFSVPVRGLLADSSRARVDRPASRSARRPASRAACCLLDRRVDAQRLVRLLLVEPEPVDADHDPLAGVDLAGRSGRPTRSISLFWKPCSIAATAPPQLLDPARSAPARRASTSSVIASIAYEPGERVDGRGQVGLVREHLLGAQGQPGRLLRRQRDRLVVGVGVQRLGAAEHRGRAPARRPGPG